MMLKKYYPELSMAREQCSAHPDPPDSEPAAGCSRPNFALPNDGRLKAGQARCQIEQKNQTLSVRSTLPNRIDPAPRRQQRIPLGLKADYSNLSEAEAKGLELGR